MADTPGLPPVLERLLEGGDHDAVGAYALEALPSEEREVFEVHLAVCDQCQAELEVLRQSAVILRRAIVPNEVDAPLSAKTEAPVGESEPVADDQATPDIRTPESAEPEVESREIEPPKPEPDSPVASEKTIPSFLAGEPVAAPVEEVRIDAPTVAPAREEPVAAPRRIRPKGRVSPGLQPTAEALALAVPAPRSILPWILAVLGVAFGIGAILAALSLAEMKENLEEEIDFQNSQIDELNTQRDAYLEQTTAITWSLAPTTLGDADSVAVVYGDPAGTSAILSVTGMAALGDDQTYQVWYLTADNESVAGPIFDVDSSGGAVVQLTPDISTYQALAVTIEPASGSEEPSSDPVIQGFVSSQ